MKKYKQFMYHFAYPTNSINALTITETEMEWCRLVLNLNGNLALRTSDDGCTIQKMFEEWFPEELI
jgi:hypothetical protein